MIVTIGILLNLSLLSICDILSTTSAAAAAKSHTLKALSPWEPPCTSSTLCPYRASEQHQINLLVVLVDDVLDADGCLLWGQLQFADGEEVEMVDWWSGLPQPVNMVLSNGVEDAQLDSPPHWTQDQANAVPWWSYRHGTQSHRFGSQWLLDKKYYEILQQLWLDKRNFLWDIFSAAN